jgi:hypothetical protein
MDGAPRRGAEGLWPFCCGMDAGATRRATKLKAVRPGLSLEGRSSGPGLSPVKGGAGNRCVRGGRARVLPAAGCASAGVLGGEYECAARRDVGGDPEGNCWAGGSCARFRPAAGCASAGVLGGARRQARRAPVFLHKYAIIPIVPNHPGRALSGADSSGILAFPPGGCGRAVREALKGGSRHDQVPQDQ